MKPLLIFHAIVTLAAGVVLIVAPAAIPGTVDMQLGKDQYLLSYFLGAAELAMAYLSFYSTKISDRTALRIIIITFIIFHAATGLLEFYALMQGLSIKLIGNVVLRGIIAGLFYYLGIYKQKHKPAS